MGVLQRGGRQARRIRSHPGSLFFNNSFPNYDDVYVRQILSELCSQGLIARISFGIYVKPMRSKFGIVYPPVGEIVKAIAKRDRAKILPTGNTAMNNWDYLRRCQ